MPGIRHIQQVIMRMLQPIQNRLMMLVGRAVLESVKETGGVRFLKADLFADENRDDIEHFQHYGFTSSPLPGAELVVVAPGGNRDHSIVIACEDRRFRLKTLKEGEVALYTDEGDSIHFKRGNIIEINGDAKTIVNSDNIELGKNTLERIVNGETFRTIYNAHTHIGNLGIPTGSPITPMPLSALSTVTKSKT